MRHVSEIYWKGNIMKKLLISITISLALSVMACGEKGNDSQKNTSAMEEIQDASVKETVMTITRESFQTVVPRMMGVVKQKIDEKGYAGAAEFCSENVNEMAKKANGMLTEKFGQEYHTKSFKFGRTSLKLRQPNNAPDAAQTAVLDQWHDGEKAGNKATPRVYKSGDAYYGMMPIRIANETCLKCHGDVETRDAEVYKYIQEKYPDDKAVDFKQGDLRGAFWVKVEL